MSLCLPKRLKSQSKNDMNGKVIFVASSTEAKHYATAIASFLRTKSVDAIVWDDPGVFSLGDLTFECIEGIASRVHGAVIIASPDMEADSSRGTEVIPRPNVLLELGFFVGRLSRKQIACCIFEGVSMPSDLDSFTHLPLGKFISCAKRLKGSSLRLDARNRKVLSNWCDLLETTRKPESRTVKCHGYSGLWSVEFETRRWRGIRVQKPDKVIATGNFLFHIPHDGTSGTGVLYADTHIKLSELGATNSCKRDIRVVDRLDNVVCKSDGSISFTSQTVSRQVLDSGTGQIPSEGQSNSAGPWTYTFTLNTCEKGEWSFEGEYYTAGTPPETCGRVRMKRKG